MSEIDNVTYQKDGVTFFKFNYKEKTYDLPMKDAMLILGLVGFFLLFGALINAIDKDE